MKKIKEEIISRLIEHSRIIYSVISDMAVYYNTWIEGHEANMSSLEKKKNNMQLNEEEGDHIKIQLIKGFSEVGTTSGVGNYMTLILRMDNVINYPLEFIDMLPKIKIDLKTSKQIKERYNKLINKIIQMADILKSTIKSLRDKPETVFKNTTSIHELENEIDMIYRQFLEYIYSNEEIDIRTLLRIRDSIVLLEQLADRIHDIADIIRVLLYQ